MALILKAPIYRFDEEAEKAEYTGVDNYINIDTYGGCFMSGSLLKIILNLLSGEKNYFQTIQINLDPRIFDVEITPPERLALKKFYLDMLDKAIRRASQEPNSIVDLGKIFKGAIGVDPESSEFIMIRPDNDERIKLNINKEE